MTTTQANINTLQLYNTTQAAAILGFPSQTLRRWRVEGDGPRFVKIGKSVRYRHQDLCTWIEDHLKENTAAPESDFSVPF